MICDYMINTLENGSISASDEKLLINLMKNGGLCILPSDSSYILTGDFQAKGVSEDINHLLKRNSTEMSLCFNSLSQIYEFINLTENAKKFIQELMPGPITFIAQPLSDDVANYSAKKLYTDGTIGIRLSTSPSERQLAKKFPIPSTPIRNSDGTETANLQDALSVISKRFHLLAHYRKIASISGNVEHAGQLSTVVRETTISDSLYIEVLREGMISKEKIQEIAIKCNYEGICNNH